MAEEEGRRGGGGGVFGVHLSGLKVELKLIMPS